MLNGWQLKHDLTIGGALVHNYGEKKLRIFHFRGTPATRLIFMCNPTKHEKSKVGFVYYEEINDYISG